MPALDDRFIMHAEFRHVDGRFGHRAVRQFVIQGAGENARGRGLADAAHAGEHPGLRNAAALEGVRDGAHHRVLADQIVEIGGPVFAGEHAIAQAFGGGAEIEAGMGRFRNFGRLAHRAIRP